MVYPIVVTMGGFDVTSDVRGIDGANAITIIWGRRDTASRPAPRQCMFELNDPTGKYNRDNVASPFYGTLGLGSSVIVQCGDTRFDGELVSLRPRWTMPDGSDTIVAVVAASLARRQKQGEKPLKSPATRALSSSDSRSTMIAWWPLEEESDATLPASGMIPSVGSLTVKGTVNFGAYTTSPACERMLTFGTGGQLFATLPSYVDTTGQLKVCGFFFVPSSGIASGTHILRVYFNWGTSTAKFIDINYVAAGTGQLQVIAYGPTGTVLDSGSVIEFGTSVLGQHFLLALHLDQNGADLDYSLLIVPPTGGSPLAAETLTGVTMGTATYVTVAPHECSGISFGQLLVGNSVTGFGDLLNPTFGGAIGAQGFRGEIIDQAIVRLYGEEGLAVASDGINVSRLTGVQHTGKLSTLTEALALLDGGILTEYREFPWFRYRPRYTMYSQAPTAWLTLAHLGGSLIPTDDDFQTTNDVTASRDGGGNARYAVETVDGYHGTTGDPTVEPTGIGTYESSLQVNPDTDAALPSIAQWNAHLGSWLERRFSTIQVDLTRAAMLSDTTATAAVKALAEGDLLAIDVAAGRSAWLPPDRLELLVQGGTEELAQQSWRFTFNTTPGRAWEVWQVDTSGSVLAAPIAAITGSDTWHVATTLGPEWDTVHAPFWAQVGGEAVKVISVFTDLPAFIAAGATASGNNASVVPALPAGITADAGQSLFLFAAIRSSGTATVNTPTGWTLKKSFGNIALLHRYYVTGVTAPTVSFTGGAGGDDTQAVIWAFSGLSGEFATGTKATPDAYTQLNGSAQNIAYPAARVRRDGGVVFYLGWKQDDNTGVSTLSGVDGELFDSSTTTGNDQSIVGDYDIYTTAADVAAGSFTVSGGAAAISRAIVCAFRPTQTFSVTRKQNNVNVAASAGAAVKGWRMGVNGL